MKYCTNCGTKLNENNNFCTKCGKPTKKEIERIKKLKQEVNSQNREKTILWFGTFLVIISSLIFAFNNWDDMTDIFKIVFLIIESIIFFFTSIVFKKLNNTFAHRTMWFLGTIFIPLVLNLVGEYGLLGNYLSYDGNGIFVYLAISSFICSIINYISYKYTNFKLFKYISYIFIYLIIVCILYVFKLDNFNKKDLTIPILCFINLLIIVINIFVKSKSIDTFISIITIIFIPFSILYGSYYSNNTIILSNVVYLFEIIILFLIMKTSKINFMKYISIFLIYPFINMLVINLNNNLEIFINALILILTYFSVKTIDDKELSVISFVLTSLIIYSKLIFTNMNEILMLIISSMTLIFNLFIIRFNIGNIEKNISKTLLPLSLVFITSSMFSIISGDKKEFVLIVTSTICFLIHVLLTYRKEKDITTNIFEISSFVFLAISSFLIIFFSKNQLSFILNQLLWSYYFLYYLVNKKDNSRSIPIFIISIINLLVCSIKFGVSLYYVLLFIELILTIIYIFSEKINFKNKGLLVYSSFCLMILLTLFDIQKYNIFSIFLNVILYSVIYYLYKSREKLPFIFRYIYTLIAFILIYKLFSCFIDQIVISNMFTLFVYLILLVSMYLLQVDSDKHIFSYIFIITIPYINLVNNVDIFSNITDELIISLLILFVFIFIEKVLNIKKVKDKNYIEITLLSLLYLYSINISLTFNLLVSALYLLFGIFSKRDSFIIFSIVLILFTLVINFYNMLSDLIVIYIILILGIILISYVFYREIKKNNK